MSADSFLDGKVVLHAGDCLDVLKTLAANSVDAVVTDPPYHLQSIHKRFAARGRDQTSERYAVGAYGRHAKGFMGKQWDGGDIAFRPELWAEVLRVLKPGGHMVAFGGARTFHRMACAIEDAGFEIRDSIAWIYGSGFPKSHNVSKAIDKAAGAEREKISVNAGAPAYHRNAGDHRPWMDNPNHKLDGPIPATAAAAAWDGWGTALKPAIEPICLGRKPLSGTVAENVLKHGTGALNIDGCAVPTTDSIPLCVKRGEKSNGIFGDGLNGSNYSGKTTDSRWPANICHDGSDEVLAAFPDAPGQQRALLGGENSKAEIYGKFGPRLAHDPRNDSGSAARFFYCAKADSDDRLGSKHPTIKPLDLMQWLVRLVCPPNGTILDPFAGTGTAGEAAWREGFKAILIERETEYQNDIRRRMALCLAGPDERKRESIKARDKDKPDDHGPLFAGADTPPPSGPADLRNLRRRTIGPTGLKW